MKILKNLIFISLILLFALSFYQVSFLSKKLYFLKEGEREIEKLKKEVKTLEIEFSQENSLSKLDDFLKNSQLIKAERAKFIEVFESKMASK